MLRTTEGRIVIAAWVLLAFVALLVLPGRTGFGGMTGFAVYQGDSAEHAFAIDEMEYNATAINVSAGEIKLNSIQEELSYGEPVSEIISISSASSNNKNYTPEVQDLDSVTAEANKNKAFDIVFDDDIVDGNLIQLYLTGVDPTEIHLCDISTGCESPGYGSVNYDGGTGYYNLTLLGISGPKDSFSIDTSKKLDIDYIRTLNEFNVTHHYNITYYPEHAVLETQDFVPESVYSWQSIGSEEALDGQAVEYYYSTDSGNTWNLAENRDLSSADPSSGKIRIRAVLISDGTSTPAISGLSVTYSEAINCDADWQPDNNPCQPDDSRLVTYADINICNTTENIPEDNGTYSYCDYCAPEWQETNSSCLADSTINQYFVDMNDCFSQTNLPSDNSPPGNNTYLCDYTNSTPPENMTNATGQGPDTGVFEIEVEDSETMTVVRARAATNLTTEGISVQEANLSSADSSLVAVRNINITVDSSIRDNLSALSLKFYYNDSVLEELDLNESTLGVYYYDEENESIEQMPSITNMTGKYVEANLTHLSIYGLYGRQNNGDSDGGNGEGSEEESQDSGSHDEPSGRSPEDTEEINRIVDSVIENTDQETDKNAEEAEPQQDKETEDEKTADQLSLSQPYGEEIEEAEDTPTFRMIGRVIQGGIDGNYNVAAGIIIIVFVLGVYLFAEIKARKGYEKP